MNTQATQIADGQSAQTILAWPYRGDRILLTEDEVREKVAATLATELGLDPQQLSDDTFIKEDLDAAYYRLASPIMTIENFFRTHLQDEMAREDLSVHLIVDKLMGRADGTSNCDSGADCACAV